MKVILRKTSLVDYPGKIASVLFLPGCNFRCPWCHNRELVAPDAAFQQNSVSLDDALKHLKKRRTVLGGAVISGGEPTLYQNLPHLIASIKSLGLAVKLDTNGMLPEMLEHLLQAEETAPDYIALDLKTAPARYGELAVAPLPSPAAALKKSAALICGSGIPHEFRTIALPDFITEKDIDELAPLVDDAFWYIRPFRPGNCLDPVWDAIPESDAVFIEALVKRARDLGKKIGNEEDKKKA